MAQLDGHLLMAARLEPSSVTRKVPHTVGLGGDEQNKGYGFSSSAQWTCPSLRSSGDMPDGLILA